MTVHAGESNVDPPPSAWNRFWFTPTSTSTIAVFRIAYGVVVALWTLAMLPDAVDLFSSDGVLPKPQLSLWQWSLFEISDSPTVVVVSFVGLLIAALAVAVGFRTRLMLLITFVLLLSIRRWGFFVMNGGDKLLVHIAFFMLFTPAGVALSVDRWRTARESFWSIPERAPWGQRLIQLQICAVYLFGLWWKLRGERWADGTAVTEALRVEDSMRFGLPYWITDSLLLANLLTYGTLAIELALAVLIWNRAARPYVIFGGVVLHLFIETTMSLGFFSTVMILSYITFVPEESMSQATEMMRRRLVRSRIRPVAALGRAGGDANGADNTRQAAPTGASS